MDFVIDGRRLYIISVDVGDIGFIGVFDDILIRIVVEDAFRLFFGRSFDLLDHGCHCRGCDFEFCHVCFLLKVNPSVHNRTKSLDIRWL